jgi:hypothetical protein
MTSHSVRVRWLCSLGMALAGLLGSAITCATPLHANIIGCSPDDPSQPHAELFATDNTAVIRDSDDPRLQDRLTLFELQVDTTMLANAAAVTGSTLVDGVYWSAEMHQTTYERSREFHLSCVDAFQLHRIADQVRLISPRVGTDLRVLADGCAGSERRVRQCARRRHGAVARSVGRRPGGTRPSSRRVSNRAAHTDRGSRHR